MNSSNNSFEKFCKILDDSNILKKHSVTGVVSFLTVLDTQIKSEVLLRLSQSIENKDYYLDYLINEILRQDYLKNFEIQEIKKPLKELNITIDQLINLDYPSELNSIIGVSLSLDTYHDNYEYLRRTQDTLLNYVLDYFANKLILFLNSKKTNPINTVDTSINGEVSEKQLTSNQIVLLLNEIGFFTHPKIEMAAKTKQSQLISMICGRNSKNIKSMIENLDKSLGDLKITHQEDIDKINDLLNKLK